MGDMALEMGMQEMAMSEMNAKVSSSKRHLELMERIRCSQNDINEKLSLLIDRLEYVTDRNDSEAPMPQPMAADEPNRSTLEENLDEIHRENMRIWRRVSQVLDDLRL